MSQKGDSGVRLALIGLESQRQLGESAKGRVSRAAVREGIAQADRGEFIEEEEMDARFEEMLRS